MTNNLLTHVVVATFEEKVGKRQPAKYGKMTFALPTGVTEEGYRNLEVVIYAPMNYVQVWTRETADVISHEDMEYDEAQDEYFVKKGKDYVKSATPWKCVADHDSAWRSGLENIFREYNLICFSGPNPWFTVVGEEFKSASV